MVEAGVAVIFLNIHSKHRNSYQGITFITLLFFFFKCVTYNMIDGGPMLDEVTGDFNVIIDDGFQQRRPQLFVLSVHLSSCL